MIYRDLDGRRQRVAPDLLLMPWRAEVPSAYDRPDLGRNPVLRHRAARRQHPGADCPHRRPVDVRPGHSRPRADDRLPCRGPCQGSDPPRHQAVQRDPVRARGAVRRGQGAELRSGQGDSPPPTATSPGPISWSARPCIWRTRDHRRAVQDQPPKRPVHPRCGELLPAHGTQRHRGQQRGGDLRQASQRCPAAAFQPGRQTLHQRVEDHGL
jgi:hypothetical protein